MGDVGTTGTDEQTTTGTGILYVSSLEHPYTRTYDRSSGTMESDGLLLMMMKIHKKYDGHIFKTT